MRGLKSSRRGISPYPDLFNGMCALGEALILVSCPELENSIRLTLSLILRTRHAAVRPSPVVIVEVLDAKQKRSRCLPGGDFSRWLREYLRAQMQAEPANDVPCGDCNACCRSSYFIPIHSEERETIAHIPEALLTRSEHSAEPRLALSQSCAGRCPMLVDGACSIYSKRPRTCRRFDCRVHAAAAVPPGSGPRAAVNERVWQWRFEYPSEFDAECQNAVLAAAEFLQRRIDLIHPDVAPADAGELAKAAVFVHEVFLESNASSEKPVDLADADLAAAINQRLRQIIAL